MQLNDITITNFGPFQGAQTFPLENQGLVSLVGKNQVDAGQDSNGSGKSSVLDALMWGLFGETSPRKESVTSNAGLKSDDVVNETAGKGCRVTVAFTDDSGRGWVVERWRKNKNAKEGRKKANGVKLADLDGDWDYADLDEAEVQRHINMRLGMDHSLAGKIMVRSQEDTYNFAQATPKQRFEILTEVEGLEELDEMGIAARAMARDLQSEQAKLTGQADGIQQSINIHQREDFTARAEQWDNDQRHKATQVASERDAAVARAQELKAQRIDAGDLQGQLDLIDHHISQLQTPVEPEGMTQWRSHRDEVQGQLHGLRHQIDAAKARLAKLQSGRTTCPECEQPVDPAHIQGKVQEVAGELQTLEAQQAVANDALSNALATIEGAQASHLEYRAQIDAQRSGYYKERAQVEAQMQNAEQLTRSILNADQEAQRKEAELQRVQAEANPWTQRAHETQQRIAQLQNEHNAVTDALAGVTAGVGNLEWWVKHIPAMKAWLFDSVVGELTAEANRWLGHFFGGMAWCQVDSTTTTKAGDVRDKVGIRFFRWMPDGSYRERPYKKWSGGEKRRLTLALDWALSARLAQRAKSRCSFLALDEVDRHLDAGGRAGLLEALGELRKEKDTVVMVTHDDNLKAAPDNRWTVVKTPEGSKLEIAHGEEDQEIEVPDAAE